MMLRISLFPAMLAAGVALSVAPAVSVAQGRGSADITSQRTSQSPYQGTVVEDIVAMVNDQVISKSDYDRAEQEMEGEARQQGWSQAQLMAQRRDLLRSLIDNQLLLSKGKDLGITGETDVVKRLDEMRKQYHMDSMEDLQKAAEAQGVSFEDLKEQIRENVIRSAVIGQEVGHRIDIAPSEIQAYYNAHLQEFQRPEQVKLNEILIATPNPEDAAQVADAQKKADDVEARLKTGADFATVAKADSSGPTAQEGGRLGDYKPGDLPKVMEDATFNLQAGQFTAPIRTKQGWLILEVTEHNKGGQTPLAEVQNQIQEQIGMTKMEPAMRDYLAKLRDEAAIQVKAPYSDSGATANEIKFIQGAYTPPQPKKKKHVERTRFRQKPVRKEKQTATNAAPPAGVPTLDQVNKQKAAPVQVASVSPSPGTQKPGKKEKIRFGQAPRETLPAGNTREVDAGATAAAEPQQVASNDTGKEVALTNAEGNVIDSGASTEKKTKTRLSDKMKEPKQKLAQEKSSKKKQKFVPPTETPEQLAQDKQDQAALGLNGDTTKKKKVNPAKGGPKRRLGDEDKNAQPGQTGAAGSSTPSGTGAPAPSTPTNTQNPPPAQSAPPAQGTTPTQPQL
jgi:peptidyl-prolyl cis-trans isomerase SurA